MTDEDVRRSGPRPPVGHPSEGASLHTHQARGGRVSACRRETHRVMRTLARWHVCLLTGGGAGAWGVPEGGFTDQGDAG